MSPIDRMTVHQGDITELAVHADERRGEAGVAAGAAAEGLGGGGRERRHGAHLHEGTSGLAYYT